ncbi:MAG: hypothetical protein KC474_04065 [Cyanobacteria bacterium HKST-UBA04]|nr:hypothetical protein [Cyanobacteria bacterium HKST-UBA04]
MIIRRFFATLWLMSLATTGCWNPAEAPPKVAIETDLVQFKDLSHQPAEQTGQKGQEDKAGQGGQQATRYRYSYVIKNHPVLKGQELPQLATQVFGELDKTGDETMLYFYQPDQSRRHDPAYATATFKQDKLVEFELSPGKVNPRKPVRTHAQPNKPSESASPLEAADQVIKQMPEAP